MIYHRLYHKEPYPTEYLTSVQFQEKELQELFWKNIGKTPSNVHIKQSRPKKKKEKSRPKEAKTDIKKSRRGICLKHQSMNT